MIHTFDENQMSQTFKGQMLWQFADVLGLEFINSAILKQLNAVETIGFGFIALTAGPTLAVFHHTDFLHTSIISERMENNVLKRFSNVSMEILPGMIRFQTGRHDAKHLDFLQVINEFRHFVGYYDS